MAIKDWKKVKDSKSGFVFKKGQSYELSSRKFNNPTEYGLVLKNKSMPRGRKIILTTVNTKADVLRRAKQYMSSN